ncbi:ABC-2 family transporter protein [Frankineae bacterium MT45]|nr:ABC-2 family transporter protein [Frankineae bacterium MT45]
MTSMTVPATTPDTRLVPQTSTGYRVTGRRVLRSEWTKFWSVRSPIWTLLVAVALTVGLGALFSAVRSSQHASMNAHELATFSATATSLSGMSIAELAIGVLGVLVITGEYATGMIRSSLTVVPKRLPVLWSKIGITSGVSFGAMLIASFAAFFLGQALLSSHGLSTTLGAPGVFRSVVGAALSVTVIAIFSLGLGALLRNTAAAISTFVGIFFVLPPLAGLLPGSLSTDITPYLPSNAAAALFGGDTGFTLLSPWSGFAVLCAYAAAITAAAAWRLRRTDA